MLTRLFSAGAFPLALLVFVAAATADEDQVRLVQTVEEILDAGWEKPLSAFERSKETYDYHVAEAPGRSPWLHYAFALVNVKHRHYPEALKLLDKTLALDETSLSAREAKIWLLIQLKRHEAAVVQLEQTAEAAGKAKDAAGVTPDLSETARYLGRMAGFLAGPLEGAVKAPRLDEAKAAITERLGESLAADFAAGVKEVEDQHTELFLTGEQARDEAKEADDKFKENEKQRLEDEKGNVAQRKEEIDALVAKIREETDADLSELDKRLDPLDRQLGQLNAQGEEVRIRLVQNEREISRWLDLADSTEDPGEQLRYRSEANRLSGFSVRLERDFAALDAQARRVRAEAAALVEQRNTVIQRYEAEMKRLGREAGDLRKQVRRIEKDEKDAAKPSSGNVAAVRSLQAKAKSLNTYQPFPLEREKERVLKAVKEAD
jgi:hypothetical protein